MGAGARVDDHPAWCPGKSLPEVRLLGTPLLWREVSHPRPLLKDSHPRAAGVDLGTAVASLLPSSPQLLPTSAQTVSPEEGLLAQDDSALAPLPFTSVPTSLEN